MVKDRAQTARVSLAEAIANAERTRIRRDEVQAAIGRAEEIIWAAAARLDEAEAGVSLARDAHADRIAAYAESGDTRVADPGLRDARLHQAEAQDELEAARAARAKLQAEIGPKGTAHDIRLGMVPVDDLDIALRAIDDRVADVIRSTSFDAFIAETAAMQRDLLGRRLVLCDLIRSKLVGDATTDTKTLSDLMMAFQLPQYVYPNGPGYLCNSEDVQSHPTARRWREAREAMKRDANAPLPW